jgi:hypothetical protein
MTQQGDYYANSFRGAQRGGRHASHALSAAIGLFAATRVVLVLA